jgi:putative ABC transport system permease protein
MQTLFQDIRYALRMIARNPGFAAFAVVALALGIGPNSAIFSVVSAVLLRPLPLNDVDRVVSVWETLKPKGLNQIPASGGNYLDWKSRNHVFEQMGIAFAIPEYGFNVMTGGEPERVPGGKASAAFFDVIGARMALGRPFLPDEDQPGGTPAAIISHEFWVRHFNSDRGAVGKAMNVDGVPRTVVGVLSPDFTVFGRQDVWIPTALDEAGDIRANRTYGVFGRLKPGVTAEQAQAEMNGIAASIAREHPETNEGWGVVVIPIRQLVSGAIAPALMILLGAVGLLLLLACANVSNLLLARASGRQREIAVRVALGAPRGRILRQLLTESLVLSLLGGALGLLLASWLVSLLRGVIPDMLALMQQMSIDYRVVVFTFAVSTATGLVFGIAPALRISTPDLNGILKSSSRSVSSGGLRRMRDALVVTEVALAVVLTVSAGLLARSFLRLLAVNPGMRTTNVLTMQLTLPTAKYPDAQSRARFFTELMQRVESIPGVESAGAIHFLPFRAFFLNSRISVWPFQIEGQPQAKQGQEPIADYRIVTPRFLETMGIQVQEGRSFTAQDTQSAPGVVIVNEALVRKHMPGENPIGKRLKLPPWDQPGRVIVGVVPNVKLYALDWNAEPAVYVPHAQSSHDVMSLAVYSHHDSGTLASAIRREVQAIDKEQPVADVRTMAAVVEDSLLLRRISVSMLGAFAVLALFLATLGIYSLTSCTVSQRTQELGLRIALGASPRSIIGKVVTGGLATAAIGVAIGGIGAYGVSRILKGFLFGISSTDPVTLIGVPVALMIVALAANFIPARRVSRLDPVVALRYE